MRPQASGVCDSSTDATPRFRNQQSTDPALLKQHLQCHAHRFAEGVELCLSPLQSEREGERIPKCWVRGQWKVYLDPQDVQRAIEYVQNNPLKEGKKKQQW